MSDEIVEIEALTSIIASIDQDIANGNLLKWPASTDNYQALSLAIRNELGLVVSPEEIESSGSIKRFAENILPRLRANDASKCLLDVYRSVETISRAEYHPKICFSWTSKWIDFLNAGNWFTRPDGLDAVEIVIRLENEYGITISDRDAESMTTVGQTVKYICEKRCRVIDTAAIR